MDNLRSLDPKWYTKGMVGETVLMNIEHYLINNKRPDLNGFARWAMEYGLNRDEIISLLNEQEF